MLNACKHANSPRFDNTYYNFYWGDKLDYKKFLKMKLTFGIDMPPWVDPIDSQRYIW